MRYMCAKVALLACVRSIAANPSACQGNASVSVAFVVKNSVIFGTPATTASALPLAAFV